MDEKIGKILNEQLQEIKPSEDILNKIKKISKKFCEELRIKLDGKEVKADVFVGGSLAKETLVKKDQYDVDVFVRFDKKYDDKKISAILGNVLGKKAHKVYGSRNYYQLNKDDILIEVVPVFKIKKPEEAVNVTDLSYFHVNYVLKKLKRNKKLSDEIILAKAFAHAQDVYGAESYIHGFSGYALELVVCYYGNFLKFIKKIVNCDVRKNGKLVIDDARFFKSREEVLREMNKSKLSSPIIIVDPTFKERNALSSLSKETFFKFQNACREFLKNPSSEFFIKKNVSEDFKKFKNVKIIKVKTNRQAGNIAGTKSKKFFGFFVYNLKKEFNIKKSGFDYDNEKNVAKFYFVLDSKGEEVVKGPPITNVHNLTKFKKVHAKAFIKKDFAYVKVKHLMNFEEWFSKFLKKEKKVMKGMGVDGVEKV